MKYRQCPKCGAAQPGVATGQCNACGIYFDKWLKQQLNPPTPTPERSKPKKQEQPSSITGNRFTAPWHFVDERTNVFEFGARVLVLAVMIYWGWLLIGTDPRITTGLFPELSFYDPIISQFILVFHEAGHLIFSIFGRFMAVAGGTLLQLLVPSGLMLAFVYHYRNPFGGSVALWLLGYAFIDAGPYCYDAMDMQLLLLGGGTGREIGGHDWNNLLTWTDTLAHHESIALLLDGTGELLVITAMAWGAWILRLQYTNIDRRRAFPAD